jgi:hypothetical protein
MVRRCNAGRTRHCQWPWQHHSKAVSSSGIQTQKNKLNDMTCLSQKRSIRPLLTPQPNAKTNAKTRLACALSAEPAHFLLQQSTTEQVTCLLPERSNRPLLFSSGAQRVFTRVRVVVSLQCSRGSGGEAAGVLGVVLMGLGDRGANPSLLQGRGEGGSDKCGK